MPRHDLLHHSNDDSLNIEINIIHLLTHSFIFSCVDKQHMYHVFVYQQMSVVLDIRLRLTLLVSQEYSKVLSIAKLTSLLIK